MNPLVVATANKGKLEEMAQCLGTLGYHILSLADLPNSPAIVEDADTFEGNAAKKALTVFDACGHPTISDDSGLEVDALDGAPGIRSARYGGPGLDDRGRCEHLLAALAGVPPERRTARFRAALVYVTEQRKVTVFNGVLEGAIALAPSGTAGFGYDPVFVPQGMNDTLATLGPDIKRRISHRARALTAFVAHITTQRAPDHRAP